MQVKINAIRQMLKRLGYIATAKDIKKFIDSEETPNKLVAEKIIRSRKFTRTDVEIFADNKSVKKISQIYEKELIETMVKAGYQSPTDSDIQAYIKFRIKYPKGVFKKSRIDKITKIPKENSYTRKKVIEICQYMYPKVTRAMVYKYITRYGLTYEGLLAILINVPVKYE